MFALGCYAAQAQAPFGFGGQQINNADMHCSEKFSDINYADDGQAYHTMDIYLPEVKKDKYPVVVHIYGSAWFSNNSKGMADLGTICAALLKAGYAVVCPNHRSSTDAQWPAQSHDIKAVIRYIRGNAKKYKFDTSFIATSGFSSGGHLSSFMAATTGTKTATIGSETIDLEGSLGKYTKESSAINAAVDWSGPIDLENMDCAGKRDMQMSPEQTLLGVPMEGHSDRYKTLSPIWYLDENDAPVIAFHGTADNVVPHCQSVEWTEALKQKGIMSEFHSVENGGHGFNMYSEENLGKMVGFLNRARAKASGAGVPDAEGFIRNWMVLEPISKPLNTNAIFTDSYLRETFAKEYFPGQMTCMPKDGDKVKAYFEKNELPKGVDYRRIDPSQIKRITGKETLIWHKVESPKYNVKLMRLGEKWKQRLYGVIYWTVTTIVCDEDMPNVRLAVGSNSASMWWLNGEEALLLSGDRRMVQDDCVSSRLTLKKGVNVLRGVVINGPGMSDFCVRFVDENGNPVVNGITIK